MHRLCFISLIQEGPSRQKDALTYARIYLPKFAGTHQKGMRSQIFFFHFDFERIIGNLKFHLVKSCRQHCLIADSIDIVIDIFFFHIRYCF